MNGVYSLELINDSGCSTFSTDLEVIINNIEENGFEVHLFPNPSDALAKIKSRYNIEQAIVTDTQGKVLFTLDVAASEFSFDTSGLESGLYFITLQSAHQLEQIKLQVEH